MSDDEIGGTPPGTVDGQQDAEDSGSSVAPVPRVTRRPRPNSSYTNARRAKAQSSRGLNPLVVPIFAVVALLALILAVVFDHARNSGTATPAATATVAPIPTVAPTKTPIPMSPPASSRAGVAAEVNGVLVPMDLFATLVRVEGKRMQVGSQDASGNAIPPVDLTTAAGLKQFHTQEQADLDQLVQTAAAVAYAKTHNLVATAKQIQTQLNTIYTEGGGKAAFLKGVIAEGYTEAAVTRIVSDNATEQNVYTVISKQAPYDGRIVRHILLATKDKALADKLAKQLQADKGSDFAALAKKYSTDTSSKTLGGSLGVVIKGQTVAPFEKAVFSQKIGQISNPVKSQYGYHIIEVTGLGQSDAGKSAYFASWLKTQAKSATLYVKIPKP